jgi:hypothetical protein
VTVFEPWPEVTNVRGRNWKNSFFGGIAMGMMDKIKGIFGGHADKADGVVDAAAEQVKKATPDQAHGVVDQGADTVKGVIKDNLS